MWAPERAMRTSHALLDRTGLPVSAALAAGEPRNVLIERHRRCLHSSD
jgi:hypothetical protein